MVDVWIQGYGMHYVNECPQEGRRIHVRSGEGAAMVPVVILCHLIFRPPGEETRQKKNNPSGFHISLCDNAEWLHCGVILQKKWFPYDFPLSSYFASNQVEVKEHAHLLCFCEVMAQRSTSQKREETSELWLQCNFLFYILKTHELSFKNGKMCNNYLHNLNQWKVIKYIPPHLLNRHQYCNY